MRDFRSRLPTALYSAAECRELDRLAEAEYSLPSIVLMKRAGRAAYHFLLQHWREPSMITVFCGSGNNGGDGFILAALAAEQRRPVRAVQIGSVDKLTPTARQAWDYARQAQVPVLTLDELRAEEASAPRAGVIVDALLGIGLNGDVRGAYREAIDYINAQQLPVLAIDLPSGLCADSGSVLGVVVRAQATITFIGVKRGLLTGQAPSYTGFLHFESLSLPAELMGRVGPCCERLDLSQLMALLPPRPRDSHKGNFGHVLVLGGDHGMGGAVLMAAEAASRVGAGLVSVGTRAEHVGPLLSRRPELMPKSLDSIADLKPLLERAGVLVIGPGLGKSDWSRQLLSQALETDLPLVLDADALNLVSKGGRGLPSSRANWVLTPHPGEAARLLKITVAQVQADRFAAVKALQTRFGGAALLKGAGTLVADTDKLSLAAVGNPGMAVGGMGDVLSGIIGGLIAQGLSPIQAAQLGAVLHGSAADLAAEEGERGMLATDLLPHLRQLVNSGSSSV